MLTYSKKPARQLNPLDFDLRWVVRAANVFLGRAKTDALLESKGSKSMILLIGALENEAANVRRNADHPLPADVPKDIDAKAVRAAMAEEIQQYRSLSTSPTLAAQLAYRIRGENQYRAFFENEVSLTKTEEGAKMMIRLALRNLPKAIAEAEETGKTNIQVELSDEEAEFVRASLASSSVSLSFQDELPERPETKRAWIGNIAARCENKAKENGTLPIDEALDLARAFSGRRVILSRDCQTTGAEITGKSESGKTTLSIEVTFPEIVQKLERRDRNNPNPGRGALTDGSLRSHAGRTYGCNGRDFVAAIPDITRSLAENLREATVAWTGNKNPTQEDTQNFLREYEVLAMTLRTRPRPRTKLEPARTKIGSLEELTPSRRDNPEHSYTGEIVEDASKGIFKSCSASAGPEWLPALISSELKNNWENQTAENYCEKIEELFGIKDVLSKQRLIEANFLRFEVDGIKPLDGGPDSLRMESHYLTNEMEENYQEQKGIRDQEIFDSKDETATADVESHGEVVKAKKHELDKAEWLSEQPTIVLELPYEGLILHRLTRYPNRRSGIAFSTTKAERLDPETSMPGRENRAKLDKVLSLQDLLTEKGKTELEEAIATGDDSTLRDLSGIRSVLEEWQNSLRRLNPFAKNPMEGRILTWLEDIAAGKDNAKCDSIEELLTAFGPTAKSAGKIPFETERTADQMAMPVRSSNLALKLLCGTGFEELSDLHNNPRLQWDMTMRWQNAAAIHEEASVTREETRMAALEQALASGDPNALLTHAIAMELAEKPDQLGAYLDSIGLPNGAGSLPKELQSFGDLLLPLKNSPQTAVFKGEEVQIGEMLELLKADGINIQLSDAEQNKINNALNEALEAWRTRVGKTLSSLEKVEKSDNQPASISLIFSEPAQVEGEEKDPLAEALTVLHDTVPESQGDVEEIATALLTHNPKEIKVTLLDETVILQKGSGSVWNPLSKSEPAARAAALVSEVEGHLAKSPADLPEEIRGAIEAAAAKSYRSRIIANSALIPEVIQTLPEHLASRQPVKEITEPLVIRAKQMAEARRANALATSLLKEWQDHTSADKSNPWGWEEEVVLNPQGAIELLCQKITGNEETSVEGTSRNYFSRQLFKEEEKNKAASVLAQEGKAAAATYLLDALSKNMAAIEEVGGAELPLLISDLRDNLTGLVEKSRSKETLEALKAIPGVEKLLQDRAQNRALEAKIRSTAADLSVDKGKTTMGKEVTYEQRGRDILPTKGAMEPTRFKVSPDGKSVETNKPWASAWLKTAAGAKNIEKRVNLAQWIKSTGVAAKTAVAFLEFCRHRTIQNVPEGIASGNLSASDRKEIAESLKKFSGAIESLGLDTKKASLSAQLHAAYALHQYTNARFAQRNPWNTKFEEPLEAVRTSEETPGVALDVKFGPVKDGTTQPSPFRSQDMSVEDDIEHASAKDKLRTAARAVSVMDKPIPMR